MIHLWSLEIQNLVCLMVPIVEIVPDRCVLNVIVMVNLCTKLINLLGEVSIAF